MNTCAICSQPMKFIQAGTSKTTGQPYPAFYACQDRSHKQPRQSAPQTPVQRFNQSLDQDNVQVRIDKAMAEKRDAISWMNAKNNAALLIAHNPLQGSTDQDIVNRLYMLALRIDSLEPKTSQINAPVAPVSRVPQQSDEYAIPPTTRVLTQNNEEPVDLNTIPF